jgi:RNA polymerase sigma factor (sigma-70 family)
VNQRTDADLVVAVRDGDKQAFGQLASRYESMTHRVALTMVGREDLAQDLAQESLLRAYLSLDRLRQPERFGSWLYGIVLNVCRSHFRNQKIDFLSLESLAGGLRYDGPLFRTSAVTPLEEIEARELHQMVLAAVHGLSEKNRTAVLLFYYEGLSVREIAVLLDTSVSAIKSRLYQARQQLEGRLAAFYEPTPLTKPATEREPIMISVTIADIVINVKSEKRMVVLADEERRRALPIWIGPFEADAILLTLKNVSTARPMSYDFFATILQAAGITLEAVRVETLKENTFYAVAVLRAHAQVFEVDARPSDALALAVRMGTPIYVTEEVMAQAGRAITDTEQMKAAPEGWFYSPLREVRTDFPAEALEKLSPSFAQVISFGQTPGARISGQSEEVPTEALPPAEERARQQEEWAQEVIAFVFGES